jgi:hypothetical protein
MKNQPVGPSCSMQTDGRADIMKLIIAFCNFAKTPQNQPVISSQGNTVTAVCSEIHIKHINILWSAGRTPNC